MIPLLCPHCGMVETPLRSQGRGPHAAAGLCRDCGGFIKWLPRVLVEGKEGRLMGGVNRCLLVGTISKYGVEVRYAASGAACASFMLVLVEPGQDGREFTTLVPCEVWGKKAEAASELEAGALVLFEGKLAKRKKGEQTGSLIVSGFEVTAITAPVPAMTGNN